MKNGSVYTRRLARAHETNWYITRRCELWLGPDHLLHGRKTFIAEQYRRLYFKDIQAVTLAKTGQGRSYNTVLCLLIAGICGAVYFAAPAWFDRAIWAVILCFAPIVVLAWNIAKGPTCACFVHTAVQREQIGALSRLRKARRVMAMVAPMLEQAQGALELAQVEWANASGRNLALAGNETKKKRPFHPSRARYHLVFFVLIFVLGLSHLVDLVLYSGLKNAGDLLIILVGILVGLLAIKDQIRSLIHLDLQRSTTSALVVLLLLFGLSQVFAGIALAATMEDSASLFRFHDWEYFPYFVGSVAVVCLVLSTVGLMRLRRYRASLRPPELVLPPFEENIS